MTEVRDVTRSEPSPVSSLIIASWSPLARYSCSEDPDRFWAEFGPSALHENNAYGQWYEDWGAWNGYVKEESTDALRATERYPVMTPDELVARIEERGGNMTVMFHPMAGGADPELAWQSLQLIEDKVIPALRDKGIETGGSQ